MTALWPWGQLSL